MSDLHFGRDRPELHAPMLAAVNRLQPDLVVISGDLTQRALAGQFRSAQAFISRLDARVLSVPGNHDVPLYNLAQRFFHPWRGFRRAFGPELEPGFSSAELVVAGMNTADPLSWQRGRVRSGSLARACARFRAAPPQALRVLVAHHPFEQAADAGKTPTRGAQEALRRLRACGLDIVLTGHLHKWSVGPYRRLRAGAGALQIQAGTGLSTRQRGEENDFNLITREGPRLSVTRYVATPDGFVALPVLHMHRSGSGWAGQEEGGTGS
ncbi:metallophosphoesterase family protein [Plastorhodobacter daqingensis]|uniref:Metallophosphoesterase family protein n=1 Tax=Plastorhodobacter daqingensis TaxID=1387281 RepID=A0ABW2UMX4_9RHOB